MSHGFQQFALVAQVADTENLILSGSFPFVFRSPMLFRLACPEAPPLPFSLTTSEYCTFAEMENSEEICRAPGRWSIRFPRTI